MKKSLLLLLQIAFLKLCFSQAKEFNIKMHIEGLNNDSICVIYYPLSNASEEKRDMLVSINNIVNYHLSVKEPTGVALIPKSSFYKRLSGGLYVPGTKFIELIVCPKDTLQIDGTFQKDYLEYTVTGSKLNEAISSMRSSYKAFDIDACKIEMQIDSLSAMGKSKEDVAKLYSDRNNKFEEVRQLKLSFIKANLDNDLSAYYLLRKSLDTFAEYYPKLSVNVRNGIFCEALNNQYIEYKKYISANEAEEKLSSGVTAPDFSLMDMNKKKFTLTNLKGKYIILDFWGSWCGWCIKDFPVLKSYYEKHKSEIEVVGIACNDNVTDWRNAVDKHKLSWIQLINSESDDVSVLYGVKAFPTKIILDKGLKIVGRFVGAEDVFYQTLNKLLK